LENAEQKQLLESPKKPRETLILRLGKTAVGPTFSSGSETVLIEGTVYELTPGKQISKD